MDVMTRQLRFLRIRTSHAGGFKRLMSRARLGPFLRALHGAHRFFQEPRGLDFRSTSLHSEEGMNRMDICY